MKHHETSVGDLEEPLIYEAQVYFSPEVAALEEARLWPKVWQHAGRLEEIPEVGDYITYEIGRDSVIVLRAAPDRLRAFHNVCPHRGRRLVDTAPGAHSACGAKQRFVCGFHGWTFDLEGCNSFILDKDDWKNGLTPENTALSQVRVDTWGGWIFVSLDQDCAPLRDYLEPAASLLDPFELDKMRYKWRQWVVFDCNWKVALEAFMEPYHVHGTHSQLLKFGEYYAYSEAHGLHGVSGFDERDPAKRKHGASNTRAGKGQDARISTYELAYENFSTLKGAGSTETLVNAARRLADELPEDAAPSKVVEHWLAAARRDDAARGVIWPSITPEQVSKAGLAWHVFPNMAILQGVTYALCYRSRPYGDDPNKCIFESYALERFPTGEEPKTEWVYGEPTAENWGVVLSQDFSNMGAVQRGVQSRGFRGALPNPHQERKVSNFHRNLARCLGISGPKRLP